MAADRNPVSLDEIAPTRRASGPLWPKVLVGLAAVLLVGVGLTVAAVAGPTGDDDTGSGVALVADTSPSTTAPVTSPTTTPPTTAAPAGDAVPTGDCGDDAMCGDISPGEDCTDDAMCGEIRVDENCTDDAMCGDIPPPADCSDPTMCGEIVPTPDPSGGG
jgi:hypothetical protein